MQCERVQTKISAYLDDELDAASSASVEDHINRCSACRKIIADFREVAGLVRGLPKFDLGVDFTARLLTVCDPRAKAERKDSDRSVFARISSFASSFKDLLERENPPSTNTLDEFSDFPPYTIGHIYFKLLDQQGGE